jgi:hypothetical protein
VAQMLNRALPEVMTRSQPIARDTNQIINRLTIHLLIHWLVPLRLPKRMKLPGATHIKSQFFWLICSYIFSFEFEKSLLITGFITVDLFDRKIISAAQGSPFISRLLAYPTRLLVLH